MARTVTETVKGVTYEYRPITDEAASLVFGDRHEAYGHPGDDFERTAGYWTLYKGVAFTPEDVAQMMGFVKISRQTNMPKRDNPADNVGYQECLQRVIEARAAGVEFKDWSEIAPSVDYLKSCQEEMERQYAIVPPGVTLEDLVACWEAHKPAKKEATTLCARAVEAAIAQGVCFTEEQWNLFILDSTMNETLQGKRSIVDFERIALSAGFTGRLTMEQWGILTRFVRQEQQRRWVVQVKEMPSREFSDPKKAAEWAILTGGILSRIRGAGEPPPSDDEIDSCYVLIQSANGGSETVSYCDEAEAWKFALTWGGTVYPFRSDRTS